MIHLPWLSWTLLLPVAGALVVSVLPGRDDRLIKRFGLLWSLLVFVVSLGMAAAYLSAPARAGGFALVESYPWVPQWGISVRMGVDGASLLLVLLTTFLTPFCFAVSWGVTKRVKQFALVLLFTQFAVTGVFVTLDLLVFYVFWEAVLIPMYLLIGIWGYERRVYATIKFFLFTMAGGVLMLLAIIALHLKTFDLLDVRTFEYLKLMQTSPQLALSTQRWLFAAFALAFAIKVPVFPLHTWLPDAHTEAPTAGSVILAGVLLKMGTYGFLRFAIPFFPQVAREAAPIIVTLAVIGILYGAAVSVVQTDLKRLVAYSSVSHLGFVMLGLFSFTPQSVSGATLQMVNHGLSTGALFLLVGMLYERRHTRQIADFGGLASVAPLYSGVFLVVAFSSLGLPGLNGFVGEFLVLLGSFRTRPVAAVFATFGVVLAALYLLWAYQRVFHGPVTKEENRVFKDLTGRERALLYPVLALIVLIGVWPRPFLKVLDPVTKFAVSTVTFRR